MVSLASKWFFLLTVFRLKTVLDRLKKNCSESNGKFWRIKVRQAEHKWLHTVTLWVKFTLLWNRVLEVKISLQVHKTTMKLVHKESCRIPEEKKKKIKYFHVRTHPVKTLEKFIITIYNTVSTTTVFFLNLTAQAMAIKRKKIASKMWKTLRLNFNPSSFSQSSNVWRVSNERRFKISSSFGPTDAQSLSVTRTTTQTQFDLQVALISYKFIGEDRNKTQFYSRL